MVRPVESTPKKIGKDGSQVTTTLMTVSIAQAVDGDGLVLKEASGNVLRYTGRYWVFPASQFDAASAEAEIMARWTRHVKEGYFGYSWGFFDNEVSVSRVLRMYLKPVPMVLPTSAGVSQILEFNVNVD